MDIEESLKEMKEFTFRRCNKQETISEYIEDAIKRAIINGAVKSNQVLSTEKLAEVFNVSRMPVREALTRLKSMGVIEIFDGKGSLVKELSQDEFIQVCLARRVIEPSIAQIAASKCTAEQVEELEEIVRASDECLAAKDLNNYTVLNYDFHIKIAEISEVKYLITFSKLLNMLMILEWSTRKGDAEYWDLNSEEHLNIVKAIKSKDALAARDFMLFHLMNHGFERSRH